MQWSGVWRRKGGNEDTESLTEGRSVGTSVYVGTWQWTFVFNMTAEHVGMYISQPKEDHMTQFNIIDILFEA